MKVAGIIVNIVALLGALLAAGAMAILAMMLLDSTSSDDHLPGVIVMAMAFLAPAPPILGIIFSRSTKIKRRIFGLVLGIVWNILNVAAILLFLGFVSAAATP